MPKRHEARRTAYPFMAVPDMSVPYIRNMRQQRIVLRSKAFSAYTDKMIQLLMVKCIYAGGY